MDRKGKIIFFANFLTFLFLCFSAECFSLEISLKQAVDFALEKGRDAKLAGEGLRSSQIQRSLSLSEFTPKTDFIISSDRGYSRSSNSIEEKRQNLNSAFQNTSKAKYQWKLDKLPSEKIGGRISTVLGLGLVREENEISSAKKEKYLFDPSITISYKQPLTPDGRKNEYSPLSGAELDWSVAGLQFESGRQEIIFTVISSFYNLVKAKSLVNLLEENLKQTEKQLEIARTQFRLGVLAEIGVLKMEVQLAQEKSNLIDADKRLRAEENLRIDELRFSRGVIPSDELQRTQFSLLQLKVDRFTTLVDYRMGQTALKKAMGILSSDSY